MGSIVGSPDLAVLQISYSAVIKSQPQPALTGQQSSGQILLSESGPRNLLNCAIRRPMKQAEIVVVDPNVPATIRCNRKYACPRNARNQNKSGAFEVEHTATGRNP